MIETYNSGHFGVDKTIALIWDFFLWPSIDRDVAYKIKQCQVCQRGKGNATNVGLYIHLSISKVPELISQ